MKDEFKSYILEEIPALKKYNGKLSFFLQMRIICWLNASYDAIYMIRYMLFYKKSHNFIKRINRIRYNRLLIQKYGIFCNVNSCSDIGKGLFIPHPHGIVLGAGVTMGENCIVYQDVTWINRREGGINEPKIYPIVGNNCIFYAGCKVIGAVHIQDDTIIGANFVLRCDTESKSIYAGVPAKRIDL